MDENKEIIRATPDLETSAIRTEVETGDRGKLLVPLIPMINGVIFPRVLHPLTLRGEQAESIARAAVSEDGLVALFMQRPTPDGIDPTPADLAPVGTLARLSEIKWTEDGAIHVTAEGQGPVRLVSVTRWEPHVESLVEPVPPPDEDETQPAALARQARDLYARLLSRDQYANEQMAPVLEKVEDPEELAYLIAATVPISPEGKQALLETHTVSAKLVTLISYLNKALQLNSSPRNGNGSGPQPQHIDPATLDRISLEEKLKASDLPPEAREVASRELERLSLLAPTSPDYNMTRTYVQWLADMPWSAPYEGEIDLERAAAVLNRDHYGLDEVKTRILEHLAVRKLRSQRGADTSEEGAEPPRQPILCLTGPPGVGKTSLGRSIAEALGRPFVRISLGGMSDEAEIRGHRRTYLGAMPGRIAQSLARTSSNQPLIMLDELDKLSKDGKGDPTAALLDVLDPEQQRAFVDHYLGIPFDISRVFFISTSNTLDSVHEALRDRLETIRLAGYTEDEKLQIAVRHLVPRQMVWHTLGPEDAQWQEKAVLLIIRNYTREAGVRQLDREIATVCRRIAAMVAQKGSAAPSQPYIADAAFVSEVLGTPRFLPPEPLETDQPGVATGVFWTPVGGDIMHIEAIMMPGGKTLTVTGQLGEVMKESAQAALSYVRSRTEDLGIAPDFYEHNDLHLHIPSGAVAKDGPSAGVALAVALVSLLTDIPVPSDIAMTGELTLRGKILPVGGIKEKVLAARRAGLRRVLIPAQNRADLDSLQPEILSDLQVIEADTMDEVLAAAFGASRTSS